MSLKGGKCCYLPFCAAVLSCHVIDTLTGILAFNVKVISLVVDLTIDVTTYKTTNE